MVLDLSNLRVDHQEDSEPPHLFTPWIQDNLLEFPGEQEAVGKENLSFFKNVITFSLFWRHFK